MRRCKNLLLAPLSSAALLGNTPSPVAPPVLLSIPHPSSSSHSHPWGNSANFLSDRCYALHLKESCSSQAVRESTSSPDKCWNCESVAVTTPFLVCEHCRSVQAVNESVDYFQIFGLEKRYEIEDIDALEGKYKEWQKKLHPDLVHSKSQRERDYAAEQSARVIDAYRSLSKPLSRAIYLLKLEGVLVDEEETVTEPELLSEIMEIREAVEEAANSQALMLIHSQMEGNIEHWSEMFADSLRNRKFQDAQACIRRMKYYSRVNEEISKKL